ncbi:hypothetical protein GI374_13405 [Paracoccus sp. S-4012]|uniref:DUF6476 family protein n=1 Tax=Paracoccus sp. S-4012 TaxID=2665648 RepID=UPI0012B03F14|nr:DUF6476 family protein [Paracoccus sp. S-4012]MRX51421.1 hypothetical protein [Paracoccus sp. S-4012]
MDERLAEPPLPPEAVPHLRFLKVLVAVLAGTMSLGMVAIVALLWLRLPPVAEVPQLPEAIALPEGARPAAVTFARDWTVVVTETGEVLLYDRGGALRQQVTPRP